MNTFFKLLLRLAYVKMLHSHISMGFGVKLLEKSARETPKLSVMFVLAENLMLRMMAVKHRIKLVRTNGDPLKLSCLNDSMPTTACGSIMPKEN